MGNELQNSISQNLIRYYYRISGQKNNFLELGGANKNICPPPIELGEGINAFKLFKIIWNLSQTLFGKCAA
ncbi:MAG: hypothetical protein DRH90_09995 [Deltaproteobacteria bacterium]|nr:MAG: hypothetical protein DRH90_09995 [Deltaproteobacteria bacterium]RLC15356.1 MAG: hypothetical protein DRI24_11165 [Deltaproteobacteria bacterium]